MDFDKIKELLGRIPVIIVLLVWLLFLGWLYYDYESGDTSALVQQRQQIQSVEDSNTALKKRLEEIQTFKKNLDVKRMQIRDLSRELDSYKASISESLDIPEFMQATLTEARKVGLSIISLKPTKSESHEYYAEQSFDLKFRGAFVQLVVFLDRLASMQKIVRAEDMVLKPVGSPMAKFVELEGVIQIKTFRYLGSKADELGKSDKGEQGGSP